MPSALEIKPFRVEWRHNCITNWQLMSSWDRYGEADIEARAMLQRHKGQVRVIEQIVVRAIGLGINVSRAPSPRTIRRTINPIVTVDHHPG